MQGYSLVAAGSAMGADPYRVVVKKCVLSGYPVHVKNRWAKVKYMFFFPEDISVSDLAQMVCHMYIA